MPNDLIKKIKKPIAIAPLITFRLIFGALMMVGAIRFMASGWIEKLYLEPTFFFKYYGFEWVQPLDKLGIYALFFAIAISAFCIMIGLFYRLASIVFFLSFSYAELIDATNYLNHYYLVILFAFWLIFLPAHRAFSLDAYFNPKLKTAKVPAWTIQILLLQLMIVYTFAGIAKLQPDWLFRAMPLSIWLPEHSDLPILGYFFQFKITAFAFSWVAAFYDLTIAYFLLFRRTRSIAYFFVLVFHLMTYLLFNIGLFPFIMIGSTLIFFPADFHQKLLRPLGYQSPKSTLSLYRNKIKNAFLMPLILTYFTIQLLLPFRHFLYKGHVLWTEEGYRFSWRVMVVEKSGSAVFKIKDPIKNKQIEVINSQYLTPFQEKQMSIQPDFILQFAHFLQQEYKEKHHFSDPIITVDAHVAINGRMSKQLIDSEVDLTKSTAQSIIIR